MSSIGGVCVDGEPFVGVPDDGGFLRKRRMVGGGTKRRRRHLIQLHSHSKNNSSFCALATGRVKRYDSA